MAVSRIAAGIRCGKSWVMVSPHRTQRPWQGEVGQKAAPSGVAYDPECYLCPGNTRAGGAVNPAYESRVHVCKRLRRAAAGCAGTPLIRRHRRSCSLQPARGLCKVLCFHPDHSLTLARMTRAEIRRVVDAWTERVRGAGRRSSWIEYVQIFENRGAMMGASNPHPHGQIWSTGFVPDEPAAETRAQREHLGRTGNCLLCDYLAAERSAGRARGFRERSLRGAGAVVGGVAV